MSKKVQPLQPIEEVIYVDCNREHSQSSNADETNSWTYKLNEPLYLPKGTQISLDNTFINLKGITGGSIEIEEDILERVDFGYYITENPHFTPIADYSGVGYNQNQMRSTLAVDLEGFRHYFSRAGQGGYYGADMDANDIRNFMVGQHFDSNKNQGAGTYNAMSIDDFQKNHFPYFSANGGCECPLMLMDLNTVGGNECFTPVVNSVAIFIPKGIYGVSQLAQHIEDFFTGQHFVIDEQGNLVQGDEPKTNGMRVIEKTDFERRQEEGVGDLFAAGQRNQFSGDGMPINFPLLRKIACMDTRADNPRFDSFRRSEDGITLDNKHAFLNMAVFNNQMRILEPVRTNGQQATIAGAIAGQNVSGDEQTAAVNNFTLNGLRGQGGATPQAVYAFIPPYDFGNDYTDDQGAVHNQGQADSVVTCNNYATGSGYAFTKDDTGNELGMEVVRYIGTTNFQFKYNTDTNGFEVIGLHNQVVGASHDTQGNSNTNAGKEVIRIRKCLNKFRNEKCYKNFNADGITDAGNNLVGNANKTQRTFNRRRVKLMKALNKPETRNSGIMIFNWARRTCEEQGDLIRDNTVDYAGFNKFTRFHTFFQSEKTARKAWSTTLWARLGFEYDQFANQNDYPINNIWDIPNNYQDGFAGLIDTRDYGFTTNTKIDNSYFQSISTLNNPLSVQNPPQGSSKMSGVQVGSLVATASTNLGLFEANSQGRMYSNSLYSESLVYEIQIDDVGGVKAQNLPQLTKHSYFLITSDILDSYKDNVKAGDPMPLLGVVPKSNLSSQDFIVAQNQIQQTTTMDKLVNSIKVSILNPNLTAPTLDPFSSVIIKIVRPNVIPPSLSVAPPPPESPTDATDLQNE